MGQTMSSTNMDPQGINTDATMVDIPTVKKEKDRSHESSKTKSKSHKASHHNRGPGRPPKGRTSLALEFQKGLADTSPVQSPISDKSAKNNDEDQDSTHSPEPEPRGSVIQSKEVDSTNNSKNNATNANTTNSPGMKPIKYRASRRKSSGRNKRADSSEIKAEDSTSEESSDEEEEDEDDTVENDKQDVTMADEDVTSPNATRSGRLVTKPEVFEQPTPVTGQKRKRDSNVSSSLLSPTTASKPNKSGSSSSNSSKKKKKVDHDVCKICLRPHSPVTNMIVFCDGCDQGYHRFCHRPTIPQVVIDEPDMEWRCSDCENKVKSEYDVEKFKSASHLSTEDKRTYLQTLPSNVLIDLLLKASTSHPTISMIAPNAKIDSTSSSKSKAEPTSSNKSAEHKSDKPPSSSNKSSNGNSNSSKPRPPRPGSPQRPPDNEVREDGRPSDPPAHYPQKGQGLAKSLPREKDQESFLADKGKNGVFTHVVLDKASGSYKNKDGGEVSKH